LYYQNGKNLESVLEKVRDDRVNVIYQMSRLGIMPSYTETKYFDVSKFPKISNQYIERMMGAFNQYNSERVYEPSEDLIKIDIQFWRKVHIDG
jgi:hypothetical protein